MSYLNKYQLELVPENLPVVKRNCPKCNEKANFINSEKFRINANKNNLDIWAIYNCENCKSTWNMTLYERIKPIDISKQEYDKFLCNDRELAKEYAFNLSIYSKNKAEVNLEHIDYRLELRRLEAYYIKEDELVMEIVCKYPIELRIDKLLSDFLDISRSKLKDMHSKGKFFINDDRNSLNAKVKDRMDIHFINSEQEIERLQAII